MNDNHSHTELKYKPRYLAGLLKRAISSYPVVVLSGARQVGKSTLLQNEVPFRDWRYLTFDDYDTLSQAQKSPETLLSGNSNIIIDEVQKLPKFINAIKLSVDSYPKEKQIILSGSANLLLMKNVSESLAGRAIYANLSPMTIGEAAEWKYANPFENLLKGKFSDNSTRPPNSINPFPLMWRGLMPRLMSIEETDSILIWWESFVATYLERDLKQLSQIDSLPDFRRLMTALALRCSQIMNQSEISRDIGIPQPTIHRYINLLETTQLLKRLPAFSVNRTKRLIKAPKIVWTDPGLVSFLSGYYDIESLQNSREAGRIFESLIYLHLNVFAELMVPKAKIFYWRTSSGKEVDFIIEYGRKLFAIEVKISSSVKYSDISNLQIFIREYPETELGIVLYCGKEVYQMDRKIFAFPWELFCSGRF